MRAIGSKFLFLILQLFSMVPLGILYLFSSLSYIFIYKIFKYRLKVVKSNLKRAFPEKSESDLLIIEKAYYKYLSDLIWETIKGFTASKAFYKKHVKFKNPEAFDQIVKSNKSAILVMGHCGNWEWVCRSSPIFIRNRIVVVYKPLSDKVFDDLMQKIRSEYGVIMVPMAKIGRFILEQKEPFLLVLLGDQSPSDSETSYFTEFFHTQTAILSGIEKLALKYKLPIYFADIKISKRGIYDVFTNLIVDMSKKYNDGEISSIHTKFLEEKIHEQPETWLWSHRRWKLSKNQ